MNLWALAVAVMTLCSGIGLVWLGIVWNIRTHEQE